MEQQWAQYGVLGLVVIALAYWILKMDKERKSQQKEFRETIEKISEKHERAIEKVAEKHAEVVDDLTKQHEAAMKDIATRNEESVEKVAEIIDKRQGETNQILREQHGILSGLKALLERK